MGQSSSTLKVAENCNTREILIKSKSWEDCCKNMTAKNMELYSKIDLIEKELKRCNFDKKNLQDTILRMTPETLQREKDYLSRKLGISSKEADKPAFNQQLFEYNSGGR